MEGKKNSDEIDGQLGFHGRFWTCLRKGHLKNVLIFLLSNLQISKLHTWSVGLLFFMNLKLFLCFFSNFHGGCMCFFIPNVDRSHCLVKLLDWGDDDANDSNINALRSTFNQEVAVWHNLDHPNVTKVESRSTIHPSVLIWI